MRPRIIPVLTLEDERLVKTTAFQKPTYVGDPINAIRIFNDFAVDELIVLDIGVSRARKGPNFALLSALFDEAFIPMCYGGGISNTTEMARLFRTGLEKVAVTCQLLHDKSLLSRAANEFGQQSVVAGVDVIYEKGRAFVFDHVSRRATGRDVVSYSQELERAGAGEIMINFVDRDGTMGGYDLGLISQVNRAIGIPLIACGGAGSLEDLRAAAGAGANGLAAGSLFVFSGRRRGVLINYPSQAEIANLFP